MSGELSLDTVTTSQTGKEVTINGIASQLEAAITGQLLVDMSGGDVTLTATQLKRCAVIIVSGASAAHSLTLAPVKRTIAIVNNNTAALTVKMGTTSVGVSTGGNGLLIMDGSANGVIVLAGGGGSGSGSLSGLTDVALASPASGDVLTYDATSHKWENAPASGGGGGGGATPAYKYWRLANMLSLDDNVSTSPSMAEIECHATPGGSAVAPTSANAFNYYGGGYEPSKAIDGNLATLWSASFGGPYQWFELYFSVGQHVQEIKITCRNDSYYTQTPYTFDVFGSMDGENYDHVTRLVMTKATGASGTMIGAVPA